MTARESAGPGSLWAPKKVSCVVQEVPVLDEAECERVTDEIQKLRDHWIPRHPALPFFSLGAANYFDIVGDEPPYYRMIHDLNPLLSSHFDWMYARVAERLSRYLGEQVAYRDSLALPGFHIFLFDEAFQRPRDVTQPELFRQGYAEGEFSNPIHCDKAHIIVDWGTPEGVDLEHPISFTMAVSTPESGAGLVVWDFTYDETLKLPPDYGMATLKPMLEKRERHLHRYRLGQMALHSGLNLHQPERARDLTPDCHPRITLQGHGARVNGVWQLFW